jgi:UPF0042 nucleotide-binding protein
VSDFVLITGMSGAGRSQAANTLEDLGWFVIDNLPPALIPRVAELAHGPRSQNPRVALVVGAAQSVDEVAAAISELRSSGATVRVLFLDALTDVLVRRYESTKRRHPLTEDSLTAAIEQERTLLSSVRESADVVIDTSGKNNYDLRAQLADIFGGEGLGDSMQTTVMSFGYKFGLPGDVDVVIDCRFLPNPYYDETLRPMSGLDEPVVEFLSNEPVTAEFLLRLENLLELLVPAYRAEGKSYLTIAMGCTGGRHRSVAMAEALSRSLATAGETVRVSHRDIEK